MPGNEKAVARPTRLHRSSAAPHSTLPQITRNVFLWRDLRRADYYANPTYLAHKVCEFECIAGLKLEVWVGLKVE